MQSHHVRSCSYPSTLEYLKEVAVSLRVADGWSGRARRSRELLKYCHHGGVVRDGDCSSFEAASVPRHSVGAITSVAETILNA
jgi:hypothetical protein